MRELTMEETKAVGGGLFSFIIGAFKLTFSIIKPITTIKAIFRAIFGSSGTSGTMTSTSSHSGFNVDNFDADGDGFIDSDERFAYRQAAGLNGPNAQIP
jgi:hypothetical protein